MKPQIATENVSQLMTADDRRVIIESMFEVADDQKHFEALYFALFDDFAPPLSVPPRPPEFNPFADHVCRICQRRLCICTAFPHMTDDEIRKAIQMPPRDTLPTEDDSAELKTFCTSCNRMTEHYLKPFFKNINTRVPKYPRKTVFKSDKDVFLYIRSKQVYEAKMYKHFDRVPRYECTCTECNRTSMQSFNRA